MLFRLAGMLTIATSLLAQSMATTGTIQGRVTDTTGAAVPGVRITVARPGSQPVRTLETDDAGVFRAAGFGIGEYSLRAEKDGFATVVVERFALSVGQTVNHLLELRPATVSERLEVRAQPEMLDASATATGVALGGDRIEETPAQNRNYLNFVLVAPGVTSSTASNAQRSASGARSALSDSGFSFGGMRGRNNGLSIDGVDNRDETTGGNRVAIGLEMVEEFRVSGVSFQAESGGAAGGSVNVVTRSGTNLWHGDATYFGQNEVVNARNPEALSPGKPAFRRFQPGASVNGPVRRDRTFFATAFEQEWERSEEWSEVQPDAARLINQALALPAFSRSGVAQVGPGRFRSGSNGSEFSFKLNHQISRAHSLSTRYAFSRGRVSNDVQGADNFTDRSARGSSRTVDHSFVAGWIASPSAHFVNELRGQAANRAVDLIPNVTGALLEIPGVVSFGQSYRLNANRSESHYQVVDSASFITGRHQLGFGASIHRVGLDAGFRNRFGGIYIFPTLADFVRGRPDVYSQAFGDPGTRFDTLPVGLWAQDRWQPGRALTIDIGLRYERQQLPAPFESPGKNFSPRIGIAWSPRASSGLVIRAGAGLFYDHYPLAFLNDAIQKDGRRAMEQYATGTDAVRAFAAALGGSLTQPLAGLPPARYAADPNWAATYSRKFSAGLERRIDANTTLTVEYAAVRGFHLPRTRNAALSLPPVYQLEQTAKSTYQGVSISLHRRLAKEFAYLVAYNAGRSLDDASDFDEQPMDPANARLDWARSRQHQRHRLAASGLFELDEMLEWAPHWLREGFDNLTFAPIFTAGSGRPLNALETTDLYRTGAYPISARPAGLGRNAFLSPATVSLDVRVMKSFWTKSHRAVLQPGIEMFNVLNHTNRLRVSPYYSAGGAKLDSYGGMLETLNARQIQFFVQFEY